MNDRTVVVAAAVGWGGAGGGRCRCDRETVCNQVEETAGEVTVEVGDEQVVLASIVEFGCQVRG